MSIDAEPRGGGHGQEVIWPEGELPPAPIVDFQAPTYPGRLIVFEGVDGSGKSTSLGLVAEYLEAQGTAVERLDLLSPGCRRLDYFRAYADDPAAALRGGSDQTGVGILCLGDRLARLRSEYLHKLHAGAWLLCDRYVFTALAEGLALGTPEPEVNLMAQIAGCFPRPDLGFVALAPAEMAIERIRQRPSDEGKILHPEFYVRAMAAFAAIGSANSLVGLDTTSGLDAAIETMRPLLDKLREPRLAE